jgi:hypothetical protein
VAEADRLRRASRVVYGVGGAAVAVGALFTFERDGALLHQS